MVLKLKKQLKVSLIAIFLLNLLLPTRPIQRSASARKRFTQCVDNKIANCLNPLTMWHIETVIRQIRLKVCFALQLSKSIFLAFLCERIKCVRQCTHSAAKQRDRFSYRQTWVSTPENEIFTANAAAVDNFPIALSHKRQWKKLKM